VDDSLVPETAEEREAKAKSVSTTRVLTQDEFRVLQQRQAAQQTEGVKSAKAGKRKRKRQTEEEAEERCETHGNITLKLSLMIP